MTWKLPVAKFSYNSNVHSIFRKLFLVSYKDDKKLTRIKKLRRCSLRGFFQSKCWKNPNSWSNIWSKYFTNSWPYIRYCTLVHINQQIVKQLHVLCLWNIQSWHIFSLFLSHISQKNEIVYYLRPMPRSQLKSWVYKVLSPLNHQLESGHIKCFQTKCSHLTTNDKLFKMSFTLKSYSYFR